MGLRQLIESEDGSEFFALRVALSSTVVGLRLAPVGPAEPICLVVLLAFALSGTVGLRLSVEAKRFPLHPGVLESP